MNLRGQIFEQDEVIHLGANGQPDRIAIRGVTPAGDSAESFDIANGKARWKTPIDAGEVAYDGKAQYSTYGGTFISNTYFAKSLFDAPGKQLTLLPGGTARLVKLVDVPVGAGATAKTVTVWLVEGVSNEPLPIILNPDGNFFGFVSAGISLLPEGYTGDLLKLQKAQIDAMAARNPAIKERFGKVSPVPVAFTHVTLFDSVGGKFLPDQTVVADKGKIAAVGSAATVKVPANARVIDGKGKTLSPGIWDAHMHVGSDLQGCSCCRRAKPVRATRVRIFSRRCCATSRSPRVNCCFRRFIRRS